MTRAGRLSPSAAVSVECCSCNWRTRLELPHSMRLLRIGPPGRGLTENREFTDSVWHEPPHRIRQDAPDRAAR